MTAAFPGTASARPAYPPAVPTSPVPVEAGADPIETAHNTQQAVAADYARWRALHSRDISPDVLKSSAGAYAESVPAQQLTPAKKAAEAHVDAANRNVEDAISAATVATDDEPRAARVWARAVRLLDSKGSPAAVASAARDLVTDADPADVPVLREELPAYLKSRQAPSDWLNAALAAVIPGAADTATVAKLANKQLAVVHSNHDRLTSAIAKDVDPPYLLDPAQVSAADYVNPADL